MPAKYSAQEVFRVLKSYDLASEKITAIEESSVTSPTLVVAGAGSGKTELLTLRVLYLVANSLARPEEILGLTFTKKAANELAKRIHEGLTKLRDSSLWPADLELEFLSPNISTYNAFANSIFKDNAIALGYESESTLLSEASAFQLAREVCLAATAELSGSLSEMELSLDPLVEAVISLSQSMNDHLVSSKAIELEIASISEKLLTLPKKTGGEVDSRFQYIVEMLTSLRPTPIVAELAQLYLEEKRIRSVLDFSDQVRLAHKALAEIPEVRASLRQNYTQVLLDEYQDTSVLQTKLLSQAFANSAVFAVGDPNQSIYGWRGASSSNLDEFERDFGSAKIFSLETSWRNPVAVLDLANRLAEPLSQVPSFQNVQEQKRVLPVKLKPKPDATSGEVICAFEQTIEQEADRVAEFLAKPAASGMRCAVLMRKRANMNFFVSALAERGIETEVVGLGGLLEVPEVVDLVSALKVIQRFDAGSELIRILTGARFRIGVKDIDRLYSIARKLSGPREKGKHWEPITLVEALDQTLSDGLKILEVFSTETLGRLREAAKLFQLLRSATALPLVDFVRLVAEEFWLDIELRANPRLKNPLAHLNSFFEIIAGYSSQSAAGSLGNFLNWLDFASDKERLELPKKPATAGVVQILTVHSAKGLEWDYVAIPNLIEDDFPSKPKNTKGWLSVGELPYSLRGDYNSLPEFSLDSAKVQSDAKKALDVFVAANREYQLREENRLIYVALTRAAAALMVSGSYWKPGNTNPRKPSRYLLEIAEGSFEFPKLESDINPLDEKPEEQNWPLDPLGENHSRKVLAAAKLVQETISNFDGLSRELFGSELDNEIELLLREQDERIRLLTEVPLPIRIPASKFKDFVENPSRQAGNYLRPIPQEPYRQTLLGTEFHTWVEEFLVQENYDQGGNLDLEQLKEIFKSSRFAGFKAQDVELEINLTHGVNTFVCKLDAVFLIDGKYTIVDWKTGTKPEDQKTLDQMTLQLALYRFAYSKLRGIPLQDIEVSFFFVSDNQEIRPEHVPEPAELLELWKRVSS